MSDFVIRAIQPNDIESTAELVASVFSYGANQLYQSIHTHWLRQLANRPSEQLTHYRGAFLRGRLVSFARLIDFNLFYGQAVLEVAGVATVCTHPDFLRRGLSSAVIRDAITHAAEYGKHLALLTTGLSGYYDRFGFMPVWANYGIQAPVNEALKLHAPLQYRKATPQDLRQIAGLYEKHWGSRVTFNRDPAMWVWLMTQDYGQVYVAAAFDEVEGYIWHDDKLSNRVEVVADTPEAATTLMAYDAKRWKQASAATLTWSLPPDDVIIPYLQHQLPIKLTAEFLPNAGWMARLIDSSGLVKTLLPEIGRQARLVAGKFERQNLIFNMQSDSVELGLRSDPNSHCELSLRDFIQVLFGSLRPSTLALRHSLSRESTQLLELLFPPRVASIGAWDWF